MCSLLRMWQSALTLAVQEPRDQATSPGPICRGDSGQARGGPGQRQGQTPFTRQETSPSPEGHVLRRPLSNVIQIFIQHLCTYCVLPTLYHSYAHSHPLWLNYSIVAWENRSPSVLDSKQQSLNNFLFLWHLSRSLECLRILRPLSELSSYPPPTPHHRHMGAKNTGGHWPTNDFGMMSWWFSLWVDLDLALKRL